MIWSLMLFNGMWRNHIKLGGTPWLTMVDMSGNIPSMTRKWFRTLLTKMFLENLTTFVVSKVSLLLVAILWLLGKLGPGRYFLSLPRQVVSLRGVCSFNIAIEFGSICAHKVNEKN